MTVTAVLDGVSKEHSGEASHISFYASLVDDFVNVVGSDSRLEGGSGDVEDFTSQAADLAHALLLCLVQDRDLVTADKDLLRVGNAIVCVVGAHNVVWQLAAGRERVDGP